MIHPDREQISLLAKKQIQGELFNDNDIKLRNHFNECQECKDYFVDCMSAAYFFYSDEADYYYATSFAGSLRKAVIKAERTVAYSIQFVVDKVNSKVDLACDFIAEGFPRFRRLNPAVVRGSSDGKLIGWKAEASLIKYDMKNAVLTVYLDKEVVGEEGLVATIKTGEKSVSQDMVYDGRDMYEAVFENVNDAKFELVITKKE